MLHFEVGVAKLRPVTEIAPPKTFLCVNRCPIRYDFRGGAKLSYQVKCEHDLKGPLKPASMSEFLAKNQGSKTVMLFKIKIKIWLRTLSALSLNQNV